eukprot:403352350
MTQKPLTKELILQKCKTEKLSSIKNVNLWGNDLDDLSILQDMPNVEIVSLSLNKIATLSFFQNCTKLSELYLRKNQITDLSEIRYLQHLPNLRVLWLSHNPCSEHPLYRPFIVKHLPSLVKLDNAEVSQEERQQVRLINFDHITHSSSNNHSSSTNRLSVDNNQNQPSTNVSNSMLMQRKPSQVSVLQQNNSIANHQNQPSQQLSNQQQYLSKSPFKGELNSKKVVHEQQQQIQQPQIQQRPQTIQQVSSQQPSVIKKSHSVRPSSAMNERSSSVTSNLTSITVASQQQQQQIQSQEQLHHQQQQLIPEKKNENILCAVLALLKELGEPELELVKRDIEKKILIKQSQNHHQSHY